MMSIGHSLRKLLWMEQLKIKIPKKFMISSRCPGDIPNIDNRFLDNKSKLELFNDSMFHICIENSKQKYYFSEKIIDCFLTKRLPIYWGCLNIGDYFNLNGIVLLNDCKSIKCIIKKINKLTKDDYNNCLNAIQENYLLALKYKDPCPNVNNILIDKDIGIKV